jgi:hypothetical protein
MDECWTKVVIRPGEVTGFVAELPDGGASKCVGQGNTEDAAFQDLVERLRPRVRGVNISDHLLLLA